MWSTNQAQPNESLPFLSDRAHAHTFILSHSFRLLIYMVFELKCVRARASHLQIGLCLNMWTWKLIKIVRHEHWSMFETKTKITLQFTQRNIICWFISHFSTALYSIGRFFSLSLYFFFLSFHSHQKFFANNTWLDEMSSNRTKLTNGIIIVFFSFKYFGGFGFHTRYHFVIYFDDRPLRIIHKHSWNEY